MIYIFCDKVHSGKTSRLMEWIKNLNNVDGILAPIVNGRRHLLAIKSNETRVLEISNPDVNAKIVSVGKYFFNEEVFKWGRQVLTKAFNSNIHWLIVDEVGILELDEKGLEPAIGVIINQAKLKFEINVVLVVRDSLVEDVIQKYNLSKDDIQFLKL
ncbi:MAG: hypothetical protein N3A61_09400 [Ignavibacteria bacterium]|nr:hypothetical protein [Ignavibacteria bacterium]